MEETKSLYKDIKVEYLTTICENFNELTPEKPFEIYSDPFTDIKTTNNVHCSLGLFKQKEVLYTEEGYVNNYNNLLSKLTMNRRMVVIDESEEKISLKTYHYTSSKILGSKYRKIRRSVSYLTFNFKTNLFYNGSINRKKKKIINKSPFRVNVKNLFNTSIHYTINNFYNYDQNEIDQVYLLFFKYIIDRKKLDIDITKYNFKEIYAIIQFKLTGIKYPDGFEKFLDFYFTKKDLKKHKYNIVDWFMFSSGLKGTKIRKLLNKKVGLDLYFLVEIFHGLGMDYFNKINDDVFYNDRRNFEVSFTLSDVMTKEYDLNKSEKNNLVSVINDGLNDVFTLKDHLVYKNSLLKYGEIVKLKAKTKQEFMEEHAAWSTLVQSYRDGVIERFYGDDSVLVEAPFKCNDSEFFPVLLRTTEEYNNESAIQSNCVRTYSEKPYCFIISLRKGSRDSNERATIEYRYTKDGVKNVQTRGKFNSMITDGEWVASISKLDEFANFLYSKNMLKLPELTKKHPNGKTTKLIAQFDDEDVKIKTLYPTWKNNIIEEIDINGFFYDDIDYLI